MNLHQRFHLNSRFIAFISGAILVGFLQGTALANFGIFQDSEIYYELYKIVGTYGINDSIIAFTAETSKFEPVIVFLFSFENTLTAGLLNEKWFLILNVIILNVTICTAMFKFIGNESANIMHVLFIAAIVTLSYLIFSKVLYVWRSIVAFLFFILFIRAYGWKRLVWMALACLTHTSFFLFILLYKIIEISSHWRKPYLLIALGIGMLSAVFIVQYLPFIFDRFTSGNDISTFLVQNEEHGTKAWLAVAFSMVILLLIRREYMETSSLKPMYVFCVMTTSASLISFGNYQFMNRIILPASLIIGFLPFLINAKTWRFQLARFLILLSIIPTVRLIYMLFNKSFSPG